jgi:hypothetical protein
MAISPAFIIAGIEAEMGNSSVSRNLVSIRSHKYSNRSSYNISNNVLAFGFDKWNKVPWSPHNMPGATCWDSIKNIVANVMAYNNLAGRELSKLVWLVSHKFND